MARTKPKLSKAQKIIQKMARRGARRSSSIQAAVLRSGISLRTYRSARKSMRAIAVRRSARGAKRGRGTWFTKTR